MEKDTLSQCLLTLDMRKKRNRKQKAISVSVNKCYAAKRHFFRKKYNCFVLSVLMSVKSLFVKLIEPLLRNIIHKQVVII